jgi:outer membrane protein assembly factor BamB
MRYLGFVGAAILSAGCASGGGGPDAPPIGGDTGPCDGSGLTGDPSAANVCHPPEPFGINFCPTGSELRVQNVQTVPPPSSVLVFAAEVAAAVDRRPAERDFYIGTIESVLAPTASGTPANCIVEKAIVVHESQGGAGWTTVATDPSFPVPNALSGTVNPLFPSGVWATDPWLDVGPDGSLYLSLFLTVGSVDCATAPPTPTSDAQSEVQLWERTPGGVFTQLARAPTGESLISRGTNQSNPTGARLDHPRMAVSPVGERIFVTWLRVGSGLDFTRTLVKQSGVWTIVPTSIDTLPNSGFSFMQPVFDPDGNLFVGYHDRVTGALTVNKYSWTGTDWSLLTQSTPPLPVGFQVRSSTGGFTVAGTLLNADPTPALSISRIHTATDPVLYAAYVVQPSGGGPDQIAFSAINARALTTWLPPTVISARGLGFAPAISFDGVSNLVDLAFFSLSEPFGPGTVPLPQSRLGTFLARFSAGAFGTQIGATTLLSADGPQLASLPVRRSQETGVFPGEYLGLATKARLGVTGFPREVAANDADLGVGQFEARCLGTVVSIGSASHPDNVWECDCNCGAGTGSLTVCAPGSISDPLAACSRACNGSDCGEALSCPPTRQCTSATGGRIKVSAGCQAIFEPGAGPPPSFFADFYGEGTSESSATIVVDGDTAHPGVGGSVAFNVTGSPIVAGTGIEISRLELRPSSFDVGGFIGATIRDIRIAHTQRLYGTFINNQDFQIPPHTAEFTASVRVDPDGPAWLTGDTKTRRIAFDNDVPLTGTLDLAANKFTLRVSSGTSEDRVDATFVANLTAAPVDTDGDGVFDPVDNCPLLFNPDQSDAPPQFGAFGPDEFVLCGADDRVTLTPPEATDACTPDQIDIEGLVVSVNGVTLAEPLSLENNEVDLPAGVHVVRWTATDGHDNASTALQTITVQSCWPMFKNTASRGGRSGFVGPTQNSRRFVFQESNLDVKTSPAIGTDGTIFFGADNDRVYAVNPDGSEKWSTELDDDVRSSPAIGFGGFVFVADNDGILYKLDPETGSVACSRFLGGQPTESSAAIGSDGTVYIGSDDNKLYAINHGDCSVRWTFSTGGDVDSSPAVRTDAAGNDTIYVGSDDNKLYAVNASGAQSWVFTTGNDIDSSPAISNDGTVVYVGSDDERLYAIHADTGAQIWQRDLDHDIESSPAIGATGTIYVGAQNGDFFALAPSNGNILWQRDIGGAGFKSSAAVDANGVVFVGSDDERVYALNGTNGTVIWSFKTSGDIDSSPAIGKDGVVYVGSNDDNLYAFGPSQTLGVRWESSAEQPDLAEADSGCSLAAGGARLRSQLGWYAVLTLCAAWIARRRRSASV